MPTIQSAFPLSFDANQMYLAFRRSDANYSGEISLALFPEFAKATNLTETQIEYCQTIHNDAGVVTFATVVRVLCSGSPCCSVSFIFVH
jgi:hypothetical protein